MTDNKNDNLIKLFEINEQRVRHHHDCIWKEETHYTWAAYILAGGLIGILALVVQNVSRIDDIIAVILFLSSSILCILGCILSKI
jgi:hypothetical protein